MVYFSHPPMVPPVSPTGVSACLAMCILRTLYMQYTATYCIVSIVHWMLPERQNYKNCDLESMFLAIKLIKQIQGPGLDSKV